jgi:glycosyltransferase involved in cell wall biosynthesis
MKPQVRRESRIVRNESPPRLMPPKISWLLPVKNGMPFIRETLASLEAQTLPAAETLVWDNGSNDGTVAEARRWIPGRLPGKVIVDRPLPLAQSLASLVDMAQNELCARIDADDLACPNRLQLQAAALEARPSVLAMGCQFDAIDSDDHPCHYEYWLPTEYCDILHGLFVNNCLLHPGVMFRRSAVLAVGNYAMASPVEDYDLWLRLAQRGEILALPDHLLKYRVRSDSVTATSLKAQKMNEAIDQAWMANIRGFAGLSPGAAWRLRQCRARYVGWHLWQVHRTFRRRDGLSYRQRKHHDSFSRVLARYKI